MNTSIIDCPVPTRREIRIAEFLTSSRAAMFTGFCQDNAFKITRCDVTPRITAFRSNGDFHVTAWLTPEEMDFRVYYRHVIYCPLTIKIGEASLKSPFKGELSNDILDGLRNAFDDLDAFLPECQRIENVCFADVIRDAPGTPPEDPALSYRNEANQAWEIATGTPLYPPDEFIALIKAEPHTPIRTLVDRDLTQTILRIVPDGTKDGSVQIRSHKLSYLEGESFEDEMRRAKETIETPVITGAFKTWRELAQGCHDLSDLLVREFACYPEGIELDGGEAVVCWGT